MRYAVKLRPGVDAAAFDAEHALVAERRVPPLRLSVYALTPEAAERLRADPRVEYVEEERTMTTQKP